MGLLRDCLFGVEVMPQSIGESLDPQTVGFTSAHTSTPVLVFYSAVLSRLSSILKLLGTSGTLGALLRASASSWRGCHD